MTTLLRLFFFCGICAAMLGCSLPTNPVTKFGFDPWSRTWQFCDSKDNDVEVKDLTVDPNTYAVTLGSLTIRNNASDVRRANVEQIQAYTEQVRAVTGMFQQITATLASMAPFGGATPPAWTPPSTSPSPAEPDAP
jgi:hypothetical protein